MKGGDSTGLRAYNVRLIVSAIREDGALSKAEIARRTGLSGQAASVIVNTLLDGGFLMKLSKVRGQVGQPSTPIALNPRGAFSIGIKIGRRSLEAILVDFLGQPVARRSSDYTIPLPDACLERAAAFVAELSEELSLTEQPRISGLGVAMPGDLHKWSGEMGLPPPALGGWRDRDVAAELEAATGLRTTLYNDATAACASELLSGGAIGSESALYIYIGTFVGGGVALGGRLYRGPQGNAGAIGSMPLGEAGGMDPPQLISVASAITLERALLAAGIERWADVDAPGAEAIFEDWCAKAAPGLAQAVVSASAVIDFESAVIDGILPERWRARVVEAVEAALDRFNAAGLSPVEIRAGTIGVAARVMGAALLPLADRFSPDAEVLARASRGPLQAQNGQSARR